LLVSCSMATVARPSDTRVELITAAACTVYPVERPCEQLRGWVDAGISRVETKVGRVSHIAPALHLHACCAALPVRHLEHFHDHVRIERMFFDGVVEPAAGALAPDRSRPGLGLTRRRSDAERYRVA
jgi:hypothetical protein